MYFTEILIVLLLILFFGSFNKNVDI